MLELLGAERKSLLLSFSKMKKLDFLILLFDRMLPELRSYFLASARDLGVIEKARANFWRLLSDDQISNSWEALREEILNALPDSEHLGTVASAFALNAGLVAADIAGLAEDGKDSHVLQAIECSHDSVDAKTRSEMRRFVYDPALEEAARTSPLLYRERQREEDDVAFLGSLPEAPWPQEVISMLRDRAQAQDSLLGTVR
jgi:hypothetical protein